MKQAMVCADDQETFRDLVAEYLDEDWRIIPGTVACALAMRDYKSRDSYICFFQKED